MKTIEETEKELRKTIKEVAKELTTVDLASVYGLQVEGHLTIREEIDDIDGIDLLIVEGKTTCGESFEFEYYDLSPRRYNFNI